MAKSLLKIKARHLRKQGKSIREIVNLTNIPLSTVSYWCRDIRLTKTQLARLIAKERSPSYKGRLLAAEKLKRERIQKIKLLKNEGIREIGTMNDREFFFAGLGLYWGEGYRSQEQIGFTSKDEKIVKFILPWFKKFFGINNADFIFRITISENCQKQTNEIEKYWTQLTKTSLRQFTKHSFIKTPHKKKYERPEDYYGTLRITIRKSRTAHRKLMGWLEGLSVNKI